MVNEMVVNCVVCENLIPAKGGQEIAWDGLIRCYVHLACKKGLPKVNSVYMNNVCQIENTDGKCEDAPCCGCCGVILLK